MLIVLFQYTAIFVAALFAESEKEDKHSEIR
jgi:hypothetical protein